MAHVAPDENLVPRSVQRAAQRGFIRTGAQSLATGFVVPAGLTTAFTGDALLALVLGLGGAVVTAVINGAQSYFSILSSGIPEDYASPPTT